MEFPMSNYDNRRLDIVTRGNIDEWWWRRLRQLTRLLSNIGLDTCQDSGWRRLAWENPASSEQPRCLDLPSQSGAKFREVFDNFISVQTYTYEPT